MDHKRQSFPFSSFATRRYVNCKVQKLQLENEISLRGMLNAGRLHLMGDRINEVFPFLLHKMRV